MYFEFKIMPVVDPLRSRDRTQMEFHTSAMPADVQANEQKDFFHYKQSFFWFNNTVKIFPKFSLDNDTVLAKPSEQFCIHTWWKPNTREKAYGLF